MVSPGYRPAKWSGHSEPDTIAINMSTDPVDSTILAKDGGWAFNEQVAAHFDSHVRKSIPGYDRIQAIVVELAQGFLRDGGTMYDLGASTGETIALLQQSGRCGLRTRFVGVDSSPPMLERAVEKCDPANAEFRCIDVTEMTEFPDARLILAVCILQFIAVEDRAAVLKAACRGLEPDGGFVLVEKVRARSAQVQRLWDEALHAHKRARGLSEAMIQHKARSLAGVLVPLTLEQNLAMLTEAGFESVEPIFLWDGFAGLIAHKRSPG